MRNYSASNGFVSDKSLFEMIDSNDTSMVAKIAVGTTTPWCVVGGAITAASAYFDDACPTRGCTHSC